jgi:hypothetical protein
MAILRSNSTICGATGILMSRGEKLSGGSLKLLSEAVRRSGNEGAEGVK